MAAQPGDGNRFRQVTPASAPGLWWESSQEEEEAEEGEGWREERGKRKPLRARGKSLTH